MDSFVKNAYDAGVQQALVDFGLTKEANIGVKALNWAKARPEAWQRAGEYLRMARDGSAGPGMGRLRDLASGARQVAPELAVGAGGLGLAGYGAYEGLREPTLMERLGLA